jgi:hypothetical protein
MQTGCFSSLFGVNCLFNCVESEMFYTAPAAYIVVIRSGFDARLGKGQWENPTYSYVLTKVMKAIMVRRRGEVVIASA